MTPSNQSVSDESQVHFNRNSKATHSLYHGTADLIKKQFKCHGNRKLQRFKRKCRRRGLNEEEIRRLICERKNHPISEQLLHNQVDNNQKTSSKIRKRQRSQENLLDTSIKSLSQLSLSQGTPKKIKLSTNETPFTLYKPSKYLKMPRKLLVHSLSLQLNCSLKQNKMQRFTLTRLKIFDRKFCLNQTHDLYKTYFDQGAKYRIWPVS